MFDNQLTNLLTKRGHSVHAAVVATEEPVADDHEPLVLRIELGRTRLTPDEVCRLRTGSVVSFDGQIGEPAAIYAGERLIGRGEVVVVGGRIGVRVVELLAAKKKAA